MTTWVDQAYLQRSKRSHIPPKLFIFPSLTFAIFSGTLWYSVVYV